jgi:hypothetical protein
MSDPCIGPIDPATDLPAETCAEAAMKFLFFPHRDGVAFMYSCDRHLESVSRWAGTCFGGCFAGGPIAKGARTFAEAEEQFGRIDWPHAEEFNALVASAKVSDFRHRGRPSRGRGAN